MDYPGFDWQPDLAGVSLVSEGLAAALPELRAARFARAWAGILPFTTDNLPIIGRAPGFDDLVVTSSMIVDPVADPGPAGITAQAPGLAVRALAAPGG